MAAGIIVAFAASPAVAEDAAGDWTGQLPSGFKVRLHIDRTPDGLTGALINASGNRTALDRVTSDGANLHFQVDALQLGYDGAWTEAQKAWQGTLDFQGRYPLSLHRATAAELAAKVQRRPQEDAIGAGPRPYIDRDVTFDNTQAGVTLAGTLTLPEGQGPFPAVVLVSGTGPNMRDEDVAGHKVFTVLADALARRGIAVLRYDKRGVGRSTGRFGGATTADFAADAAAAIAFLEAQPGIDARRTGILGHSGGGIIAPMVAGGDSAVAFVVMLAGPAIRGDRLFLAQSKTVSRLYGVPDDYIARRQAFDRRLYDAVMSAPSAEEASARVRDLVAQGVADKVVDTAEATSLARDTATAWERYFLAYDPAPALRRVTVPVLAVYGSRDAQVPADENVPAARQALKGNAKATVLVLPGLNHLLQRAETGSPQDYGDIDETLADAARTAVTNWIADHTR